MVDDIDINILNLLKINARIQWKEIGKEIHMTGQAVGNRIRKMEDTGIIKAYSVFIDEIKLGKQIAFINVFMKTNEHAKFLDFMTKKDMIVEAHKISGEGCYILKVLIESQDQLNKLLDEILFYGNYRLNLSINKVKG